MPTTKGGLWSRLWPALLWGLVSVLIFVIYSGSISGPFTFDDKNNIEENSHIRLTQITAEGLKEAAFESSRPAAARRHRAPKDAKDRLGSWFLRCELERG